MEYTCAVISFMILLKSCITSKHIITKKTITKYIKHKNLFKTFLKNRFVKQCAYLNVNAMQREINYILTEFADLSICVSRTLDFFDICIIKGSTKDI